jgi:hypothetical protein
MTIPAYSGPGGLSHHKSRSGDRFERSSVPVVSPVANSRNGFVTMYRSIRGVFPASQEAFLTLEAETPSDIDVL